MSGHLRKHVLQELNSLEDDLAVPQPSIHANERINGNIFGVLIANSDRLAPGLAFPANTCSYKMRYDYVVFTVFAWLVVSFPCCIQRVGALVTIKDS